MVLQYILPNAPLAIWHLPLVVVFYFPLSPPLAGLPLITTATICNNPPVHPPCCFCPAMRGAKGRKKKKGVEGHDKFTRDSNITVTPCLGWMAQCMC